MKPIGAWMLFAILPITAALMAFSIDRTLSSAMPQEGQSDPLFRLVGSAKEMMGDLVFLKADEYFHGGLQFDLTRYLKEDESHAQESTDHAGHDCGALHDENQPKESLAGFVGNDWIAKINSRVGVTEHRHLEGDFAKEMLPLLYVSTTLNPHNVTMALTSAYWAEYHSHNLDDAIDILKKALVQNPGSWELHFKLGELYLKKKNSPETATRYLERASELVNDQNARPTEQRLVFYLLGQCYEAQGFREWTLEAYQKALTYFGADETLFVKDEIQRKIKELQ